MCICINCQFYNSCWIKKGINKIPKIFLELPVILKTNNKHYSKFIFSKTLSIKILLNKFIRKQKYEFDVIECEGFCEKPGEWLIENL
uniref:Ycf34 n=1 Tax=Characiopsis acuta TaxID=2040456 RepID=A0A3R5TZM6_9STRA|nr:hypothetical protein Ycf34 [Characiopsis acuta]QAA11351.1 hypothetical protein Ycf34 [Characiopsis acuta]